MCGINGFNFKNDLLLKKMSEITYSRGPDNEGFFSSDEFSVSHNRLSIIDLTKNASQPMYSEEFNTLIMFNGEIFNHKELRKKLEESKLRFYSSHSDTETLLLGLSYYGLEFLGINFSLDSSYRYSIFFS